MCWRGQRTLPETYASNTFLSPVQVFASRRSKFNLVTIQIFVIVDEIFAVDDLQALHDAHPRKCLPQYSGACFPATPRTSAADLHHMDSLQINLLLFNSTEPVLPPLCRSDDTFCLWIHIEETPPKILFLLANHFAHLLHYLPAHSNRS